MICPICKHQTLDKEVVEFIGIKCCPGCKQKLSDRQRERVREIKEAHP